ncbi:hypothetical protein EZ449_14180 [Pedobacter frigidisoli]|uniref:Uncharacterized protein n=1 Tax=Pedobacter frigidisoli TaxID=2530455 RepID=A0A4R0NYZ4_9SPHI|nr:hypothetical protein [Pedobacter frigidisoli]TCD07679.1 hypothetical protein EZ449_14180 [Pedobacter frigidisoli]
MNIKLRKMIEQISRKMVKVLSGLYLIKAKIFETMMIGETSEVDLRFSRKDNVFARFPMHIELLKGSQVRLELTLASRCETDVSLHTGWRARDHNFLTEPGSGPHRCEQSKVRGRDG